MKMHPFGNFEDWQRLFRVQGLRFLVTDLWMDFYQSLGALAIVLRDEYTSFLPRKSVEQTLAYGRALISDSTAFDEYERSFRAYMHEFLTQDATLDLATATKEQVRKLLAGMARTFHFYSKTEFFYTDEAYRALAQESGVGLGERLQRMGVLKNDGRIFMNKVFFSGESVFSRVVRSLAERFGVPERSLQQYSRAELLSLFDGRRVPDDEVRRRQEAFYWHGTGDASVVQTGSDARLHVEAFLGDRGHVEVDLIVGTIAHRGIARGRARVFTYSYDRFEETIRLLEQVRAGDVLVAETTSPDFMPACTRAAAIVTDQGGLLSHAAIVSRELDIPCIVGTGNATTVIKDGDLVEVDAEQGIVRIIKKVPRG